MCVARPQHVCVCVRRVPSTHELMSYKQERTLFIWEVRRCQGEVPHLVQGWIWRPWVYAVNLNLPWVSSYSFRSISSPFTQRWKAFLQADGYPPMRMESTFSPLHLGWAPMLPLPFSTEKWGQDQGQLHNSWGLIENENVGPLVENTGKSAIEGTKVFSLTISLNLWFKKKFAV